MQPEIIVILAATLIYIALGVGYIKMLADYCPRFYCFSGEHPGVLVLSVLIWPIIFIVLITWRTIEPLTSSRRKDWE